MFAYELLISIRKTLNGMKCKLNIRWIHEQASLLKNQSTLVMAQASQHRLPVFACKQVECYWWSQVSSIKSQVFSVRELTNNKTEADSVLCGHGDAAISL